MTEINEWPIQVLLAVYKQNEQTNSRYKEMNHICDLYLYRGIPLTKCSYVRWFRTLNKGKIDPTEVPHYPVGL